MPYGNPNRYYTLKDFLKIVLRLMSQYRVILVHCKIVAAFVFYSLSLLEAALVM